MPEFNSEHIFPPRRKTLVQLTGIPVDLAFTKRLLTLLEAHGAIRTPNNLPPPMVKRVLIMNIPSIFPQAHSVRMD